MARRMIEFEFVDHGCDGESYFPGCGVAFTRFDGALSGIGVSAREAAKDAMDQAFYTIPTTGADDRALEAAVKEFSDKPSFDPDDPEISPEWHHYVTLRWRIRCSNPDCTDPACECRKPLD